MVSKWQPIYADIVIELQVVKNFTTQILNHANQLLENCLSQFNS
jgi:hypothetical protein